MADEVEGRERPNEQRPDLAPLELQLGEPFRYLGPYRPTDVQEAQAHRFWVQTRIGMLVASVISASLLILVLLVAILALDGRDPDYIKSVVESLQPYILPAFGVLVGYGLGRARPEGE